MPDPNALYDDMEKLNALFEELCWDCDDELMFSHDGSKVIITNKTQELVHHQVHRYRHQLLGRDSKE